MTDPVRRVIKNAGDAVLDSQVWRVGGEPMRAIGSVVTNDAHRSPGFYHKALEGSKALLHATVELNRAQAVPYGPSIRS